ncbi:MAG: hypothetical protein ABI443_11170 [Chthoniobacterales bacterium]
MTRYVILFLALMTCCAHAADGISFSSLKAGDTITVHYTSKGCFHDYSENFTFKGGKPVSVKVTQIGSSWDEKLKKRIPNREKGLGTLVLNKKDLSRLDNLFKFYRNGGDRSISTTQDSIHIKLFHNGILTREEKFYDHTGATHTMKNVLTFPELSARLEKKN